MLPSRLLAAGLLLAVLAACAAPTPAAPTSAPTAAPTDAPQPTAAPEGEPIAIVDGSGVELTFDTPPQRVVCLYTRCTEVLATLGVTPIALAGWIANVGADPGYFPQPNDIVALRETNDDLGFDPEELAALEPDLVLGWEELRAPLEGIAPVHAVSNDMDSYQESHAEIRAFAKVFGREAEAEAAIQAFLNRLEAYRRLSPNNLSIMNIFVGDAVYYRDGQSGTCNLFKEVAGCDWPDPANASTWSVETSLEGLIALNPDAIITTNDGTYADEAAYLAALGEDPLWHEISAYQNARIFFVPSDYLYNLDGMGTVGAARMLDHFLPRLYPEVFPAPLTDAEVQAALNP